MRRLRMKAIGRVSMTVLEVFPVLVMSGGLDYTVVQRKHRICPPMTLRNVPDRADLPNTIREEIDGFIRRTDIPEDVKQSYMKVREQLASIEKALSTTMDELQQLNETVKQKEKREKKLEHQLIYNKKTGLANHHVMDNDIHSILEEANSSRIQHNIVLFIISLDESYDTVKKTLEPTVSEWIIYQVAERLKTIMPANGRLYHTREAEFVLLLVNVSEPDYSPTFARRISQEVQKQFQFPEHTVTLSCNIGIARYPDHARSKRMLLRNADIALSVARKRVTTFVEYLPQMGEDVIEKMELQNSIIRALEEQAITEINKQFSLYFQPVVEMTDVVDGEINYRTVGAECLIRWRHPKRGMIPPARFIPVAEETGLIIPIGNWTLFTVSDQLKAWSETGLKDLYVSVNLSPRQFKDDYLIEHVERMMVRNEINPERIRLEITEGSVMDDPEGAIAKIAAIHDMGIHISVDDFGTGYSSLNYLKRFPIDTLKLDRSFMEDILVNRNTQGIVRAIISMAQSMGIDVVAEGIESSDQALFLMHEGCRLIQGHYFGRPLSSYEFQKTLQESREGVR